MARKNNTRTFSHPLSPSLPPSICLSLFGDCSQRPSHSSFHTAPIIEWLRRARARANKYACSMCTDGWMTGWCALGLLRFIGACLTIVLEFQQLCVHYLLGFCWCTVLRCRYSVQPCVCACAGRTRSGRKSNFQTDTWRYSFRFRN